MDQSLNRPYTVEEVATLLRVSVKMIWRLCRSGELPAVKVGRKWFIKRAELDAHLGIVPATPAFAQVQERQRIKPGPKPKHRTERAVQRIW